MPVFCRLPFRPGRSPGSVSSRFHFPLNGCKPNGGVVIRYSGWETADSQLVRTSVLSFVRSFVRFYVCTMRAALIDNGIIAHVPIVSMSVRCNFGLHCRISLNRSFCQFAATAWGQNGIIPSGTLRMSGLRAEV